MAEMPPLATMSDLHTSDRWQPLPLSERAAMESEPRMNKGSRGRRVMRAWSVQCAAVVVWGRP